MAATSPADVTQLLQAWSQGETSALEKLTPLVYKELHRLAHRYMSFENPGHTLQTTALVNEAYLRLVSNRATWQNRAHFFAISAQLMRQILVDFALSTRKTSYPFIYNRFPVSSWVLPQLTVGSLPVSHSRGIVWDSICGQRFWPQESPPTMKSLNCPNPDCTPSKESAGRPIVRYGFYQTRWGKRRRYQ